METFKYLSTNVSVNLPKCDNLIKRFHESHSQSNTAQDESLRMTLHGVLDNVSATSSPPARKFTALKTMSISELFKVIIKEAEQMNPKQFCLPDEYIKNVNLNVNGTEKDSEGSFNDVDSSDLMKLPARKCYYCQKICSNGEVISCDFCPAHFHIDCLNPPLCNTPDVKWMCPLHPHHILDKITKNSCSITELTQWWNKLAVPTSDEDIKTDFIKKIKAIKRKRSAKMNKKCSVKIPDIIKYHYEHALARAPVLRELMSPRENCVFKNRFIMTSHGIISKTNICCNKEEGAYGLDAMNWEGRLPKTTLLSACAEYTDECGSLSSHFKDETISVTELSDETNNIYSRNRALIEIVHEGNTPTVARVKPVNEISEDLSLWDKENKRFKFTSHGVYDYENLAARSDIWQQECSNEAARQVTFTSSNGIEESKPNSTVLPWNKIQRIINPTIAQNFFKAGSTLEKRLKEKKLHSIICNYPPSLMPNTLPYPLFCSLKKENFILHEKPLKKVHAVLCPLSHRAAPIYMYGNICNAGTDISNDAFLNNYGSCDFVSKEHATIFYDEYTNMYELLNYSQYSTVVDGLLYTGDLSSRPCNASVPARKNVSTTYSSGDKQKCSPVAKQKPAEETMPKRFTSVTANTSGKRIGAQGAHVLTKEPRVTHKKLLQDIDKLVTKSQKEMTSIADEDLNEISKILQSTIVTDSTENDAGNEENSKTVFIIRRKRKPSPKRLSKSGCEETLKDRNPFKGGRRAKSSRRKNLMEGKRREVMLSKEGRQISICNASKKSFVTRLYERRVNRQKSDLRRQILIERKKNRARPVECSQSRNTHVVENADIQTKEDSYQVERVGEIHHIGRQKKNCKCRMLNLNLPIGHGPSWEKAAPLYHGSYIRFGCIEFVFCIVGYPAVFDERSYVNGKSTQFSKKSEPVSVSHNRQSAQGRKNDDLSDKLISILNVLSSKSRTDNGLVQKIESPFPVSNSNGVIEEKEGIRRSRSGSPITCKKHISSDGGSSISSQLSAISSLLNSRDSEDLTEMDTDVML